MKHFFYTNYTTNIIGHLVIALIMVVISTPNFKHNIKLFKLKETLLFLFLLIITDVVYNLDYREYRHISNYDRILIKNIVFVLTTIYIAFFKNCGVCHQKGWTTMIILWNFSIFMDEHRYFGNLFFTVFLEPISSASMFASLKKPPPFLKILVLILFLIISPVIGEVMYFGLLISFLIIFGIYLLILENSMLHLSGTLFFMTVPLALTIYSQVAFYERLCKYCKYDMNTNMAGLIFLMFIYPAFIYIWQWTVNYNPKFNLPVSYHRFISYKYKKFLNPKHYLKK